jgi:hypothetical protein
MGRSKGLAALVASLGAGLAVAFVAQQAAAADLTPHRAIYSLSLGKADASGRFVNVGGAVKTTLERTCDAWITAEQVNMLVDTQVGGQLKQYLDFTGWESLDGKSYRFVARSRTNGELKNYKGTAKSDPDRKGEAVYTQPKPLTMELPPGTHFYFGLSRWLIERAQTGATRAETTVFDGTDDTGPQRAVAFIIPLAKNGVKAKAGLGPLVERPGWRVRLAFFPVGGTGAAPEYEVEVVMLDNSVTPRLEMVFPGFTAVQTLEKIEALNPPSC